ncbi:MAG: ferredoxin [Kibdelosporangium sp.]
MTASVRVDDAVCMASGLCVAMSPELFRQTGEGIGEPVESRLTRAADVAAAQDAADCCPAGAIEVDQVDDLEGTTR